MLKINTVSKKMFALFTAIATTMMFTGCVSEDSSYLTDSNGDEYRLIENSDGSETARYSDGREVTFKRDDDGNLNFLSGAAGLLGGLAAGYYLHKGFSTSQGGYYDSNTQRYYQPLNKDDDKSGGHAGRVVTPAKTAKSNSTPHFSGSNTESTAKSSSSSKDSSIKSGFGSAGARSAVS